MKKRLLITSIVMILVVAVALSTATYAWFTSNTTVTANEVTMTAGTSQTTALGIAWAQGASNADYGTSIDSKTPSTTQDGGFQPAAPLLLDTVDDHSEPQFFTQFIDAQGYFKGAGISTAVYRFTQDAQSNASNKIWVANLAQSGAQTVYLKATIGGAGAALVRIAVYEVTEVTEPSAATNYTYKGLLSATPANTDTAEGEITGTVSNVKQAASDLLTATSTGELNLGSLDAQDAKAYAVYVWLDGAAFDEAQSSKQATIELTFSTTKSTQGTVTEINAPQAPAQNNP